MKTSFISLGLCAISAQLAPALGNSIGMSALLSTEGLSRPSGFGPSQPPVDWIIKDASAHENQGILLSHGTGVSGGQGLFESTAVVQSTVTIDIATAQLYAPEPPNTGVVVRFVSHDSPPGSLFPLGGMPEFDFQPIGNSVVGILRFENVQSHFWNRIFHKPLVAQTETLTWGNGPLNAVAVPDSPLATGSIAMLFGVVCWSYHQHRRSSQSFVLTASV